MAFADDLTPLRGRPAAWWRSPVVPALAGLWLFLFVIECARPCFFLQDDNATWFSGAYLHDFRVLAETGRLAEVNFYQYGGEPFLEQGQTAVLYPPVYVGVALAKGVSGDVRWSIEWIAAAHLTLGFLGCYFWLRRGGVGPLHAALAGLAWVLNPFVLIVGASWITVTFLACYLPWLFWAVDRLWLRPTYLSSTLLGGILALFFLQGYAQWVLYSTLFLGIYALVRFFERSEMQRPAIFWHLGLAVLIFLILTAPLLLPMLHAADVSAMRSKPLSIFRALDFRVTRADLGRAQLGLFRPGLIFGISTAILYCPALWFCPVMILRFVRAGTPMRRRLFPLLVLSLLAILCASRWHVFLTLTPLFERFRWPFKVFVFADFFLIASLAWSVSSDAADRASSTTTWRWTGSACLALVLFAQGVIALAGHDRNFLSKTTLPTSNDPLPPGMDPQRGRVIAMGNGLPEASSYRFFTHCYATFFAVPSLGGYDPLVSAGALRFSLGLDMPNMFYGPVTPALRQALGGRAVRYWLVQPGAAQLSDVEALPGLKLLASDRERMIFEDTQALPMVYAQADSTAVYPMEYSGNSMLIALHQASSPLEVSVGPTDGWWYRIDRGPWLRATYRDDRLEIFAPKTADLLEISYFDSRFRQGLRLSLYLIASLGLVILGGEIGGRRKPPTQTK